MGVEIPTPVKVELNTIRFGDVWWLRECAPTLDAYCARNGYDLREWDQSDMRPHHRNTVKFLCVEMMQDFLKGDSDWMGYVDSDVFVHEDCPPLPLDEWKGIAIRPDGLQHRTFARFVETHFKNDVHLLPYGWRNRNAGVWFCDRDAARRILEVAKQPYHPGLQEQHHFNWWLILAQRNGLPVMELPEMWNQWWHRPGTRCFHHLTGRAKDQKWRVMEARGDVRRHQQGNDMSESEQKWNWIKFDREPYGFAVGKKRMEMDDFHIDLLYQSVRLKSHREKKVVVEIGSFEGATATALLKSVDEGVIESLHLIDISPTEKLRERIRKCSRPDRVTLHDRPFWELEIPGPDMVFIDGGHAWPALADTLHAFAMGASTIVLHDSHAWPKFRSCWGSTMAANCLRKMPGRDQFEDSEVRDGMGTHRGFFVSVPEGIDLDPVRRIAESLSPVP